MVRKTGNSGRRPDPCAVTVARTLTESLAGERAPRNEQAFFSLLLAAEGPSQE